MGIPDDGKETDDGLRCHSSEMEAAAGFLPFSISLASQSRLAVTVKLQERLMGKHQQHTDFTVKLPHDKPLSSSSSSPLATSPAPVDKEKNSATESDDNDLLDINEVIDGWLHIRWTISRKTAARAESAMSHDALRSQRVLKLHQIEQNDSGPGVKELLQQIEIPKDAHEWIVRIPHRPITLQIEYGALFGKGRFFSILHSGPTTHTQKRHSSQQNAGLLTPSTFSAAFDSSEPPSLTVQGFFLIQGRTSPRARLQIDDRDIPVDSRTGEFEWKIPLSNGRIVVPVSSAETRQVRRGLLAVETNFHLLDPEPPHDD
ncbi:DUF4912 domain-containing protein [Planctomicrobium sp. SH527]|uniref:DUF4912 domain-containing protein n=1 Tax=Planctomicrobium sp. SH527 TaxID=3448123 RepID=UPI003F5BA1B7